MDPTSALSSLQLFTSQTQSLMLLTTVAMPVFSKKNETVSGRSHRGCSRGGDRGTPMLLDLAEHPSHPWEGFNADSQALSQPSYIRISCSELGLGSVSGAPPWGYKAGRITCQVGRP